MKNRKLLLIVSLVLALAMSLGGTLAYLTDTDADVNVMTLGNVKIVQNEQMRDENGNLVEYQNKPALPAVYDTIAYDADTITIGGEKYEVFASDMKNVNDKIVTVTNMGNTRAYVRTIIAIEAPVDFNVALVHLKQNESDSITWSEWDYVTTDADVRYAYTIATYTDALEAKATSAPSLLQVFLDKETTNEHVAMLGDEFEIIALSQAVQAEGFADAETALNEAFGIDELAAWLGDAKNNVGSVGDKNDTNNPPYEAVDSIEDLLSAEGPITATKPLTLTKDTATTKPIEVGTDGHLELDLGGYTLSGKNANGETDRVFNNYGGEATISNGVLTGGFTTSSNTGGTYASVTSGADAVTTFDNVDVVSYNGAISAVDGAKVIFNSGSVYVDSTNTAGRYNFYVVDEGSELIINGGNFSWNQSKNIKRAYIYAGVGTTVYVNGGTFGKASTRSGYTDGILGDGTVIITGGTFGFNPSKWVAVGYQAVQNGTTWTVVAQ